MEYFEIFGLPPKLAIEPLELERRFHRLSREHHPDFHTTQSPEERERALRMSALLNDAYRTLRDPTRRVGYLLRSNGLEPDGSRVPQALLAEVFEINEELDEVRAARQRGEDVAEVEGRLRGLLESIGRKRAEYDRELLEAGARWDAVVDRSDDEQQRRQRLAELAEVVARSGYLRNLESDIESEVSG
jgi:molecular chaperone HscB